MKIYWNYWNICSGIFQISETRKNWNHCFGIIEITFSKNYTSFFNHKSCFLVAINWIISRITENYGDRLPCSWGRCWLFPLINVGRVAPYWDVGCPRWVSTEVCLCAAACRGNRNCLYAGWIGMLHVFLAAKTPDFIRKENIVMSSGWQFIQKRVFHIPVREITTSQILYFCGLVPRKKVNALQLHM